MSVASIPTAAETTERSNRLRAELKAWEKIFATANEGRKAGRDDIKQHPEIGTKLLPSLRYRSITIQLLMWVPFIAQKYKEYTKLRNRLSSTSSIQPSSSPPPAAKKRKLSTPQKPVQQLQQCLQVSHALHPSRLDPYDSPRSVHLTPTHHRTFVGPTPQKNGRVLGLFDLLSPASDRVTPSKRQSLDSVSNNAHVTPSKRRREEDAEEAEETLERSRKHSRTPQSSSKRIYLDSFLTPSTRRVNEQRTPGSRGKVSKLRFDETPEFLRRDSQRAMPAMSTDDASHAMEDGISWSPVAIRMPAKPAGRGLSALVKGLRNMEDEKLDEELELLREMEAEEGGIKPSTNVKAYPNVLVQDSQMDMPLGPDGEGEVSSEDEDIEKEGKGRDGKPLKVWKKKGQKRSTRRVNMKPVTAKWKPEAQWKGEVDGGDELAVAETQAVNTTAVPGQLEEGDINENGVSDGYNTADSEVQSHSQTQTQKEKDETAQGNGKTKPPKKKISATAHANFRALKIKNKQSKGKRGGKFSRRR
ncbi:regulatory particle non-ATPase [Lignoscripta atroalba]|nr:regulatory particle non-ATPase [Lignoscripta atroalba]